jgi:hypothetical protein
LGLGVALAAYEAPPPATFPIPDVKAPDAANFIVTATVLSAMVLVATIAPALRALRVDPMVAVRHEQRGYFRLTAGITRAPPSSTNPPRETS